MSYVKKTFILAAVLALATAFMYRHELLWQWRISAGSAPPVSAAPPKRPLCAHCNLILISLDTVRTDRLGFMGSARGLTPNLDRIAGRSLVFENAFTNAFYTTPSHMTAFTSLYPTTHRVDGADVKVPRLPMKKGPGTALDPKYKTIAELLRAEKYRTTWLAPLNLKFLEFKDGFGRGYEAVYPSPFVRGLHFPLSAAMKLNEDLLKKAFAGKSGPAFYFIHSYVSHLPYVYGDDFDDRLEIPYRPPRLLEGINPIAHRNPDSLFVHNGERGFDLDKATEACRRFDDMSECFKRYVSMDQLVHRLGQWQLRKATRVLQDFPRGTEMQAYAGGYDHGIAEMDKQVGDLWDFLEKSGRLKDSVVVFFSDHGEELFDHGEGNHSSFHEHTARVPWLIYVPGAEPFRDSRLVSLVDLLPTIFDILDFPVPKQAQGHSAFDSKVPRDYVYGAALGVTYVRGHEWKYILGEKGSVQLFNVRFDPLETENLAGLAPARAKIEELESALSVFKLGQAL